MMKKMSPRLTLRKGWLCAVDNPNKVRAFMCTQGLSERVDIPPARSYWIEARLSQWPDGSGSPVWVEQIEGSACATYSATRQKLYSDCDDLMPFASEELATLIPEGSPPRRIFFRLLYEEV